MKQRYEERVAELEEERNAAEQEQERVQLELNRALDVGRRLQAQLSQAGGPAASQDIQTEVCSGYDHHWMLSSNISVNLCTLHLLPCQLEIVGEVSGVMFFKFLFNHVC